MYVTEKGRSLYWSLIETENLSFLSVCLYQDFVTQRSVGSFHWVGLTDERTGQWEWVNQTPYIMNRR